MLAYVQLVQCKEKELGCDVLTHQKWSVCWASIPWFGADSFMQERGELHRPYPVYRVVGQFEHVIDRFVALLSTH
jgi:hypothetical protein